MKLWFLMVSIFVLIISFPVWSAKNQFGLTIPWGYRGNIGPERWGQLNPAFSLCMTGKLQSPININQNILTEKKTLIVNYQPAILDIINDGTANLLINGNQVIIRDGRSIQLNFSNTRSKEIIFYHQEVYKLIELHFHSPSENKRQGEAFPLEVHLVHQGKNGVLVIGVFVKGGTSNNAMQKIIDYLPTKQGQEQIVKDVYVNPRALLPKSLDYVSFLGSLTTPPCLEGIQWVVMNDTITASPAQIMRIRQAANGDNARPIQPLNNRDIFSSIRK